MDERTKPRMRASLACCKLGVRVTRGAGTGRALCNGRVGDRYIFAKKPEPAENTVWGLLRRFGKTISRFYFCLALLMSNASDSFGLNKTRLTRVC